MKKRYSTILYKMASKNRMIAVALITCMTLRLKLWGRLGSFFLKKYIIRSYGRLMAIAIYPCDFSISLSLLDLQVMTALFPGGNASIQLNDFPESQLFQQLCRPVAALACPAIKQHRLIAVEPADPALK